MSNGEPYILNMTKHSGYSCFTVALWQDKRDNELAIKGGD